MLSDADLPAARGFLHTRQLSGTRLTLREYERRLDDKLAGASAWELCILTDRLMHHLRQRWQEACAREALPHRSEDYTTIEACLERLAIEASTALRPTRR